MDRTSTLGVTLLKIASVYMVGGLAGGLVVAITKQYGFATVHSHVSLVGWVTLALTGLVYLVLPQCATTRWARVHVWLHNLGLPVMIGSLTLYVAGVAAAEPLVALGSVLVLLGLLAFTVNVFRHGAHGRHTE
jgi:hypothetical protein